eukprot:Gb_29541 [translate_table: standard]
MTEGKVLPMMGDKRPSNEEEKEVENTRPSREEADMAEDRVAKKVPVTEEEPEESMVECLWSGKESMLCELELEGEEELMESEQEAKVLNTLTTRDYIGVVGEAHAREDREKKEGTSREAERNMSMESRATLEECFDAYNKQTLQRDKDGALRRALDDKRENHHADAIDKEKKDKWQILANDNEGAKVKVVVEYCVQVRGKVE